MTTQALRVEAAGHSRYTFRLRMSSSARAALESEWGRCRWIWNESVAKSKAVHAHHKATGEKTTCGPAQLDRMLTEARTRTKWLRDGSSVPQQRLIRDFGKSRAKALKDIKARLPVRQRAGMPTYKKKREALPSLNYTQRGFRLKEGRLHLAGGIVVRPEWSRELPKPPSSVRVYRDSLGHWYGSFVVAATTEALPATGRDIGIDWGVKETATTTSDEHDLPHAQHGKNAAQRLAKYQRMMARRRPKKGQPGSKGYREAKRQTAKLHKKVARQRQDTGRKWAKRVVRDHDRLAVEDFRPKFLAKSTTAKKAADAAIGATKRALIEMARKHEPYYATMHAAELAYAERNFADKGRASMSLVPFGYGDGGGGPTREMLQKARRLRSLEGSPRVEVAKPAEFFAAAEEEYGAAALADPAYAYPYEELDRIWKTVLLHQFHDILPGSSIAWVHREAAQTYAAVAGELAEITAAAVAALGAPDGAGVAVLNASPYDRGEVVELAADQAAALPPEAETQPLGDGRSLARVSAPGLGAGTVGAAPAAGAGVTAVAEGADVVLGNALLRVVVDADALLTSVRDLTAGREVLAPGARVNLLQLHPDHPNRWDAWDIDKFYRRTRTDLVAAESVEVTESGPLRAAVRVVRTVGRSRIVQDIGLAADSGRVDFTTEIDWREEEKVLKAAFPLDVHAGRSTSEIQFGHVHRPTHANTGWEAAKFEICAHRWLHVGEPGYGVAVLNDATYGHDVTREPHEAGLGTTVRLTILRAPRFPDPETDLGVHRYRYALLPGADVGAAVAQGLALNLPLRTARTAARAPLVSVSDPAITVESVKPAEDRSGDVVVQLYESRGGRASGTLTTSFRAADVRVTDLLERPLESDAGAARAVAGGVELRLRPFQILTLRMRPVR